MAVSSVRLLPTSVADSWRWMRLDLLVRLVPMSALYASAAFGLRPGWAGWSAGRLDVQLGFGLACGLAMFAGAGALQLPLARRRGALRVPADGRDALLQTAYYLVNAAVEEAFFRGLLQGGLGALLAPPVGAVVATSAYVLYHRLGAWAWPDVAATGLAGVPLALAYWLLPGPPSLLGVTIAHAGATCGFLGPGPWLLRRLGRLG